MRREYVPVRWSNYRGRRYVVTRTYTQIARVRLLIDRRILTLDKLPRVRVKEYFGRSHSTTTGEGTYIYVFLVVDVS